MTLSEQLALGALIVAFLSLVVSITGYFVAKKSYRISKKEHDEKYFSIKPYLINSIKWYQEKETYISFALSFTNEATISNALSKVVLQLDYYNSENSFSKIFIEPINTVSPINLVDSYQTMNLPAKLDGRSTISGWITYKIPPTISKNFVIELYKINAHTPMNEIISVDTHIVSTVTDEK